MADEYQSKSSHEYETTVVDGQGRPVETKDRGLFEFMGKKEDKKAQEEVLVSEFDQKVTVSEPESKLGEYKEDEKKHTSLLEKLHRSDSKSSSSSDEEEGETEEKKKKRKERKEKKGLKDKTKEKITGDREEEKYEDTTVPVEKYEEETVVHHAPTVVHHAEPVQPEEKKGFLDKIKEKLPGQPKKTEEIPPPPPPQTEYAAAELPSQEGEAKEKKGFLEKIKEKLPGYHPKTEEEKEKAGGAPSPH